jgi:hypothetical protein
MEMLWFLNTAITKNLHLRKNMRRTKLFEWVGYIGRGGPAGWGSRETLGLVQFLSTDPSAFPKGFPGVGTSRLGVRAGQARSDDLATGSGDPCEWMENVAFAWSGDLCNNREW